MSRLKGLNPSSAFRWGECAASAKLSQPFLSIELSKPHAEDGERMHSLCEALINKSEVPACTEAELNEVRAALDYLPEGGEAEVSVEMPEPFTGMKGRVDYVHSADGVLTIADFKWGYTSVEANMNPQLMLAALALLEDEHKTVRLIIIQPRAFDNPVKEWDVPADMIAPLLNRWAEKYVEAQSDNPTACAGVHCKYCPAAHACKTIQDAAASAIDEGAGLTGTSPEELGRRLHLAEHAEDLIKNMQRALSAHVEALLEAGTNVPGYELKESLGHRQWNVPEERLEGLAQLAGIDLYERKVISPAEATRRGIPKGFQDTWTSRKATKKVTKVKII